MRASEINLVALWDVRRIYFEAPAGRFIPVCDFYVVCTTYTSHGSYRWSTWSHKPKEGGALHVSNQRAHQQRHIISQSPKWNEMRGSQSFLDQHLAAEGERERKEKKIYHRTLTLVKAIVLAWCPCSFEAAEQLSTSFLLRASCLFWRR